MSQIIVGVDDTVRAADAVTRVLVVYASTHGHTGTIAARIAEAIGPAAELHRIDDAGQHAPWEYDAIVVGASAHRRRRLASGAGFSGWPLR